MELGWELSHARARMRSIEIVCRKEAAMCQLFPGGMRVPLPEPVAHCAGATVWRTAGESGATDPWLPLQLWLFLLTPSAREGAPCPLCLSPNHREACG